MKRLLSLLLVIAMLFGICTIFTACDDSWSVSEDDKDDDDDKKKNDKDDDDEEEEEEEPTLNLKGLKIVLPKNFELETTDTYGDNSAYAAFSSDKYCIDISCGPLEDEVAGMDAQELRDYLVSQMDPENEDSEVGEWAKQKKNGTYCFYAIKDDNTTAVAFSFYVADDYGWQVQIFPQEEDGNFNVDEMINLVTGWKCSAPDPDDDNDDNNDDVIVAPDNNPPVTPAPENTTPGNNNQGTTTTNVTVDEAVIYDNLGVTVAVSDLQITNNYYCFTLDVENASGYPVSLSGEHAVINGSSTIDISLYGNVEDGSSTQIKLTVDRNTMDALGAETIGDLEFSLTVYNSENYELLDEGTRISFTTSAYGYRNTIDDSGFELFAQQGIRVVIQSIDLEDVYYPRMTLYVENTSSDPVTINLENIVVNGWVLPVAYFYCRVMPGTFTIDTLDLSELEMINIADVSEIQNMLFDVNCYHSTQYHTIYAENGIGYYPGDPSFVQNVPFTGTTVYDDGVLTLELIQLQEEYDRVYVWLYLRNNTNQQLFISLEDTVINGYGSGECMYGYLPTGTQSIDYIPIWFAADADFESLSDLQSLEIDLEVSDENYRTLIDQTITIPVN